MSRKNIRPVPASEAVREFHETFGLPVADNPVRISPKLAWQRHRMLTAEVTELQDAVAEGELPGIAQELADCVYVAYGTALTYGIDLDAVLAEVHAANMTKMGADGRPILKDGKIQKGPYYVKPDVARVLAGQGTELPEGHHEGPRHLVVVTAWPAVADQGGPQTMYDLQHPVECDRLRYGQRCSLDAVGRDRTGWPTETGAYLIWSWSSQTWTDSGWEYDSGVYWELEPVMAE